MFTLTTQDLHGIVDYDPQCDIIRKLMPIECWRLQGFTDEQFIKAQSAGLSDARLYKMAGNAVSVPVITALGEIIKRVHENSQKEADNG
jgi:DNA (cytosine-5)-methyltransferase 1